MSYIIKEAIKKRLNELLPDFNPIGIDKKLYTTCIEDFYNYLTYHWKKQIEDEQLTSCISYSEDIILENLFYQYIEEDVKAIEDFNVWFNIWLATWKKRVQILFGEEPIYNKNFRQTTNSVKVDNIKHWEIKELKEPIIEHLISKGEIVGTEMLADEVIKRACNKVKHDIRTIEDKIGLLNTCLKIANDLCLQSGKLIFISLKDFNWKVAI